MKYKEIYNIIPQLDGIITHKMKVMHKIRSRVGSVDKVNPFMKALIIAVIISIIGTIIIEIIR